VLVDELSEVQQQQKQWCRKTNLHLFSQPEEWGPNTLGTRGAEHIHGSTSIGDRDGE
jgi:hypothetical protein